jgi:hypothetical protein
VLPPGDDPTFRQSVLGAAYGLLICHVDDVAALTRIFDVT